MTTAVLAGYQVHLARSRCRWTFVLQPTESRTSLERNLRTLKTYCYISYQRAGYLSRTPMDKSCFKCPYVVAHTYLRIRFSLVRGVLKTSDGYFSHIVEALHFDNLRNPYWFQMHVSRGNQSVRCIRERHQPYDWPPHARTTYLLLPRCQLQILQTILTLASINVA